MTSFKEDFGDWVDNAPDLAQAFNNAAPFEHVIIPRFFSERTASAIEACFPAAKRLHDSGWKHYDNPLEQKYSLNSFAELPVIEDIFNVRLQSSGFIELMKGITGIPDLEADPHLHGAGLHAYPDGGKLDIHLDYSVHPISGKERRCNLIVYLNRDRIEGGDLQLWDAGLKTCTSLVSPDWNTAILFRTSDLSYHGIPKPIRCSPDTYRKSLAIYYVSEPRPAATIRHKAEFFPHPDQPVHPKLLKLYETRKHRIIDQDELERDWPDWRSEGRGWW